jgi:hypothetical protein
MFSKQFFTITTTIVGFSATMTMAHETNPPSTVNRLSAFYIGCIGDDGEEPKMYTFCDCIVNELVGHMGPNDANRAMAFGIGIVPVLEHVAPYCNARVGW